MKNISLLVFLLLPFCLLAQSNNFSIADLKYYNQVLGDSDEDFEVTEVPAEFADEPVIALCEKIHFGFLKVGSSFETKGVFRKRIKIQDKSVLADFAEYYYQNASSLGLKHIKPDGSVIKIDLDDGIVVETQVPKYYRSFYNKSKYYKTAIPNLEVGDILDYYQVISEPFVGYMQLVAPITRAYPVAKQDIIFEVDKLWRIYAKTFNNAAPFVEDETGGVNKRGKVKSSIKRLVLSNTNLPAQKEERWSYKLLSEPILKITVSSGIGLRPSDTRRIEDERDLKSIYDRSAAQPLNPYVSATVLKYLRRMNVDDIKNELEKINLIYYAIKAAFFENVSYFESDNDYFLMTDVAFANFFKFYLRKYDIKAYHVVGTPRYFGQLEDLLTVQEMTLGVYIPSTDKYYWAIDNYRLPGELDQDMTGTKAKLVVTSKFSHRHEEFEDITIPASTPLSNQSITDLDVEVTADNKLNIACAYEFTGAFKSNYNRLISSNTDYISKERKVFLTDKELAIREKRRKSKVKRNIIKDENKTKADKGKTKDENIENWFKRDFEIDEIDSYEILSSGITVKDPTIKVNAKFSSDKYIKKAGPNMIFELGKLISSQVQLEEDEINNRTNNINLEFAKTIINNFNIKLPEGLTAQGIEAFNMDVNNKCGAFVSTVSQEGNMLKVKTIKTYKLQDMDLEDWPKMVEMLEAAFKFSQLKMVLK